MDYLDSTYAPNFKANPGESIQFPFKTTHPNVSISVFQQTTEIGVAKLGIELEKVGAPGDPVEGSNVFFICTTSSFNFNLLPFPPKWTIIDHTSQSIDLLPVKRFPNSTHISFERTNKGLTVLTFYQLGD